MFGACATSSSFAQLVDPQSDTIEGELPDTVPTAPETHAPKPSVARSTKPKAKRSWVKGLIFNDGAAVYQKPDFDSEVVDYLDVNMSVFIARKPIRGIGGMGLFHVIRYGKKQGYIADTDVKVSKESVEVEQPRKTKKSPSKMWENEEQEALGDSPLYFRRYLGGALAMVDVAEKFSGRRLSDDMMFYGMRMMGPGTLFDGPPLDFNFWFTLDKPGYYKKFSSGEANGFMLFGDVAFMLPFIESKNWLATYGLGLMWAYSSYRIPVNGVTFDSQEFKVGFDVTAGVGRKIGKYLLRGDAKYFIERQQYFGYMLSLMGEY